MRLYEVESSNASDNQFITSNDIISMENPYFVDNYLFKKVKEKEISNYIYNFIIYYFISSTNRNDISKVYKLL